MSRFFNNQGVLFRGKVIPWYAGEFHYWHHEPDVWRSSLRAMKELGLRVVSTCVPWSLHERSPGDYNFGGNFDLGAFLDEVSGLGLFAMVQIGPTIGAEMAFAGLPKRIVSDPEMLTQTSRNTPIWCPLPPTFFPLPSYASEKFQGEVGTWFSVVGEVLKTRMNEEGGVLAVSVNTSANFRRGKSEVDTHPDARVWWSDFSSKYPTISSPDEWQISLKRLHFCEEYESRSLRWLEVAATRAGLSPCGTILPTASPVECGLAPAQAILAGPIGLGFDDLASDSRRVRERAIYLSSTASYPYAHSLPIGGAFYRPVRSESEEQRIVLGALAGGVRAFSLAMAGTRPGWHSGILDPEALGRNSPGWLAALLSGLHKSQFHLLRRDNAGIAILVSRAEWRVACASSAIASLPSSLSDFLQLGPSGAAELSLDESARLYPRWLRAVSDALDMAQLSYRLVDEQCLHLLGQDTKAVIFPTLGRVNGGTWAALHALSGLGMQIVIGPEHPAEDEFGRMLGVDSAPPAGVGMLTEESLEDIEGLSQDLLGLAGDVDDLWIAPENRVHCSLFRDEQGYAKVLFVENPGQDRQEVALNVSDGSQLEDGINGEIVASSEGVAHFSLPRHFIRFFLIHEVAP